jgi:hypothetical protein
MGKRTESIQDRQSTVEEEMDIETPTGDKHVDGPPGREREEEGGKEEQKKMDEKDKGSGTDEDIF